MTLIGSTIVYGGREYTVLAIDGPNGCRVSREGGDDRYLSVPATWRAYERQVAAVAARAAVAALTAQGSLVEHSAPSR